MTAGDGRRDADVLLRVRELGKTFHSRARGVRALRGVSFDVHRGGTLGLVGESGSGKSTAASCVLRLTEPDTGTVEFAGTDVGGLSKAALRRMRARMQMVFQDPYGSLDPRFSVRALVEEPLLVHGERDAGKRRAAALDMLDRVGLPGDLAERNAHAFSGGQRQRIAIARALVLNPDLLVLDEPVTALDVSVQAQVLNLLSDLQDDLGLTYLFIVHDLAVARHVCHRIAVMYRGEIVEIADSADLFAEPLHPYTVTLLLAAPVPDPDAMTRRRRALGDPPPATEAGTDTGCPLRARCPVGAQRTECAEVRPPLEAAPGNPGHQVACHFPGEMRAATDAPGGNA